MSNFASQFNGLEGTTIGEKRKHLCLLLNTIDLNKTNQDALIDSIRPNGYLENIFKIDVLLRLKRFEELCELFRTESRLIFRVLKNEWFCEQLTKNVPPERLVDEIFPSLCLVVRLKLLNKIVSCCNDTKYVDRLFESLEITYGLKTAVKLLPACSTKKTQTVISKYNLKLPQSVQLKLAKRNPESLRFYYEQQIKTECTKNVEITSKELCKFLIENNQELFWLVYENFKVDARLGRRTAEKAIKNNTKMAVKEPNKILSIIDKKRTAKYFGDDFESFYSKWFPKKIDDMGEYSKWEPTDEWLLLKSVPKARRFEIFNKTFESMYETKLIDKVKCITPELLDNIKDCEIREGYAKAKISTNPNEWEWLKYLKKENAIGALKKRIRLTSNIKTRAMLLVDLINVCKLNDDVDLLLDIIKYYVQNHRNETPMTHEDFLGHLAVMYEIEKFDDTYWSHLNSVIVLNLKAWERRWYAVQTVCEKQLQHYLINNASSDLIRASLKHPLEYDSYNPFYYYRNVFKYLKDEHVILAMDAIEEVFKDNEKGKNEASFSLLQHICEWNKVKHHHKITIPQKLFESFKYEIEINNMYSGSLLSYLLRTVIYSEVYTLYWKCLDKIFGSHTTLWLLKNKPEVVLNNFDTLVKDENLKKLSGREFCDLLLKYEQLGFRQKMIKACIDIFNEEDNDHKNHAIRILSHLLSVEDFDDIIKKIYPEKTTLDITTEEERLFYSKQCSVAANLFNLQPPIEAFTVLKPFLKGDYLKSAQCSLNHLLQVIPQNKIGAVLDKLKSGPLTLQKIISATYCNVFYWKNSIEYLRTICQPNKHVSSRKHLFVTSFKFFKHNPYEECWLLLKETVKILDKNDVEAFDHAVNAAEVPFKYRALYIKFLWGVLVDNEKCCPDLKNHKYKLLSKLTPSVIQNFPRDFCLEIIRSELSTKATDGDINVTNKFIAKCVINTNEENLNELLEAVMVYLKNSKKTHRYLFIRRLCLQSIKTYTNNFDRFGIGWYQNFSETKAFREHVFLKFTTFYHKNEYHKLPSLLVSFFEDCCKKYTVAIDELFVTTANEAFRPCLRLAKVNRDRPEIVYICDFIRGLFEAASSTESKLFVLKLIEKDYDVPKYKFGDIFNELHKNCDDLITLHLNNFEYALDET